MKISNQLGLTLGELILAMGLSSITIMVASTFSVSTFRSLRTAGQRVDVGIELLMINNFFAGKIPSSGGPNLPFGSFIMIEDDCKSRRGFPDCDSSDRLSLVEQDGAPTCSVIASQLNILNLERPTPNTCCLDGRDHLNRHIVLTNGANFAQLFVTRVNIGACTIEVAAGPLAGNDNLPQPWVSLPVNFWVGAQPVLTHINTYWLDREAYILSRFHYTGADRMGGENFQIIDRVYDFQVAAGYDFKPTDGTLTDTGDNNDEWLYNAPNTAEVFNDVPQSLIRMISIGLLLGAPAPDTSSVSNNLLNGPRREIPKTAVRGRATKFALRSTAVFQ